MTKDEKLTMMHNLLESLPFRELDKLKVKYNLQVDGSDKRDEIYRAVLWYKCFDDSEFMEQLFLDVLKYMGMS